MADESKTVIEGTVPLGLSSGNGEASSSETYTKEQIQKLISDALSKQGDKHKLEINLLKTERDSFKTNADELADIAAERDKLKGQVDELASDDPDKFNFVKKDRELGDLERLLKADRRALEQEKGTHAERVKLAEDTMREISIWDIAAEYPEGNAEKLKDLSDAMLASSEEQIRKVADILWVKPVSQPAKPLPVKVDSGKSVGTLSEQTIIANFINNPDKSAKANPDYYDWRRRKGI